MIYKEKEIILKSGRKAILRSPKIEDAEGALDYFKKVTSETEFLLFGKEDTKDLTFEEEKKVLQEYIDSPFSAMICCIVDGKFIGNCDIKFDSFIKSRHRAVVGISILKEYWNLGIGTKLFESLIEIAKQNKYVSQLELEFIEGNDRARYLYEKMGFKIMAVHPKAVKLSDGKFYNKYLMIKELE